jgi:hypothetical protein
MFTIFLFSKSLYYKKKNNIYFFNLFYTSNKNIYNISEINYKPNFKKSEILYDKLPNFRSISEYLVGNNSIIFLKVFLLKNLKKQIQW